MADNGPRRPANYVNQVVECGTGRPVTARQWHVAQSGDPGVCHRIVGFDRRHRHAVVQNDSSDGVNFSICSGSRKSRAGRGHRRGGPPPRIGIAGSKGGVGAKRAQVSGIGDNRRLCRAAMAPANTQLNAASPRPYRIAVRPRCIWGLIAGAFSFPFRTFIATRSRIFDIAIHLGATRLHRAAKPRLEIRRQPNSRSQQACHLGFFRACNSAAYFCVTGWFGPSVVRARSSVRPARSIASAIFFCRARPFTNLTVKFTVSG